ncbi:hypothetical protein Tco_1394035 [Tanacetum coccineum]
MSTSYITISSDSDDESTGSSISYIILSNSKAEDIALLTLVLDYVQASDINTESSEEDPQEAGLEESLEEDTSEEDPSEEDVPDTSSGFALHPLP